MGYGIERARARSTRRKAHPGGKASPAGLGSRAFSPDPRRARASCVNARRIYDPGLRCPEDERPGSSNLLYVPGGMKPRVFVAYSHSPVLLLRNCAGATIATVLCASTYWLRYKTALNGTKPQHLLILRRPSPKGRLASCEEWPMRSESGCAAHPLC